jgi:cell wall assembly regulator SMI1
LGLAFRAKNRTHAIATHDLYSSFANREIQLRLGPDAGRSFANEDGRPDQCAKTREAFAVTRSEEKARVIRVWKVVTNALAVYKNAVVSITANTRVSGCERHRCGGSVIPGNRERERHA